MNALQEVTQQSNGQCTGRSPLCQAWLDGLNHAASALS